MPIVGMDSNMTVHMSPKFTRKMHYLYEDKLYKEIIAIITVLITEI